MANWWRQLSDSLAKATRVPSRRKQPPVGSYRQYTTEFDQTLSSDELSARFDEIVEQIPSQFVVAPNDREFEHFRIALRTSCTELSQRLAMYTSDQRRNTVVSLLFDHSGSLRDGQTWYVSEVAETLASTLTESGIPVDILGFTTSRWRGGKSRAKWIREGCPSHPGRLNDLLHIVYLDASVDSGPGPHQFPLMRNSFLFKENIDGEALAWAAKRLIDHPSPHKVLIVVSDGAPVDDSTLLSNWPSILSDHLAATVTRIADEGLVHLGGLGLPNCWFDGYPHKVQAASLVDLARVAPRFIETMVANALAQAKRD